MLMTVFFVAVGRSKLECEAACPSSRTSGPVVNTCQQPLVTGPCRADMPRWGSKDGECVQFTYGGCGGNNNNFR